jgi:diguanylate cyclase
MSLRFPRRNTRWIILLIVASALIVFILFVNHDESYQSDTILRLTEWSDETGAYPLPHEFTRVEGESHRISAVLPVLTQGECLIFRTENLPVTVTLGGEVLYDTGAVPAHETIGDEWHFISLPENAAGQTVTIAGTILFAEGSNFIRAVYVGQKADFLQAFFRRNIPAYFISVLLFLLGFAMLVGAKLLLNRQLMSHMPASFALLCIVLGLWTATQTEVPELLWGNTPAVLFCTYGLLPLCSVFVCFFLRTLPAPGWLRTAFLWLGVSQIAFWAFAILGETLHFAAYVETLPYTRALMMALLGLALIQLPGLIRNRKEYFYLLAGLSCLGLSIFVDLINVMRSGVYDYAQNTRFGILSLTLLVLMQFIVQIRKSLRTADEADLMRRLAYRDSLTGLGNRLALARDQEALLSRRNGCIGIVQMDINGLKLVNDHYGHEEGDALIVRAANAIRAAFDEFGTSYRIGGDEFMSLLFLSKCEATCELCRQRLSAACDEQNTGRKHALSIAMGFAVYNPATDTRFYDFVHAADMRMYERKREMKAV